MPSHDLDTRVAPRTASAPERADLAISERLAQHRDHPGMRVAGALGDLGDQPPLLGLSGAVLAYGLWSGDRRLASAGGRMAASVLVAIAVKQGLKRLIGRTRPHVVLDGGEYEVRPFGPDDGAWQSFPSGHTAGSVAAARAFARDVPALAGPAYAAAAAIALVQVPRGAHYPTDVAAGLVIGLAAEALVARVASASGLNLEEGDERASPLSKARPLR